VTSTGTPPVRRDRRRVRRGPVSLSLHVLIEYGVAVLMIVAPFLFSFDATAAELASVLVGAGVLVLAVLTDAPTGIARSLPVASHVVIDYVLGLFFIVAPFVLGFSGDDDAATAFFIILGIGYVLLAVLTRYHGPKPAA
jgi:SPW repeat